MTELRGTAWPIIAYTDAPAAIAFLVDAFGFETSAVYRGEDETVVVHAELRWPTGGGVMVGSEGAGEPPFTRLPTGSSAVHLVTDEPDALHARVTAAGGEIARELRDEPHGSRGFTARDPEGNLWSFGTDPGQ